MKPKMHDPVIGFATFLDSEKCCKAQADCPENKSNIRPKRVDFISSCKTTVCKIYMCRGQNMVQYIVFGRLSDNGSPYNGSINPY